MANDTQDQLDHLRLLLKELVLPFHAINRDLTIPVGDNNRDETDSEHSFTLALIALVLTPQIASHLDSGKVTQLALVHDLVEVYADDTSIWAYQAKLDSKEDREAQAAHLIADKFSMPFPNLVELVHEYEAKQTEESIFVWALDKFVNFLTAEPLAPEYYQHRGISYDKFLDIYNKHYPKGTAHRAVAPLYKELMQVFLNNKDWYAD